MKLFYFLKRLLNRPITLFVIALCVLFFVFDFSAAIRTANVRTLNRLRPERNSVLLQVGRRENISQDEIEKFFIYYEKIIAMFPERADAFGLTGYLTFYSGDKKKAIENYKEAINRYEKSLGISKPFFYFHFNLANIYLANKNYSQASIEFQRAIEASPAVAIKFIEQSQRLYLPVVQQLMQDEGLAIDTMIKADYRRAYLQLAYCLQELGDFKALLKVAQIAIKSGLDQKGEFLYYAGVAALELREIKIAVELIRASLGKDPVNIDAMSKMVEILKSMGNVPAAVQVQAQLNALKKTDKFTRYEPLTSQLQPF